MVDSSVKDTKASEGDTTTPGDVLPFSDRAIIGLTRAIAALPVSFRSSLGALIGYVVGCAPFRDQRIAHAQIEHFLRVPRPRKIVRGAFSNAGCTLLESLNLKPILREHETRISCHSWPEIEMWTSDSRPIIALTGHTGNWDLLAAYMIYRGIPITTIGREARSQVAQHILAEMRLGYGIETIWRSDRRAVKRLMECLKQRRVVAALIDQDTRVESTYVPFFGVTCKTPASLVAMGKRANARFVSAFLFRVGFMRYQVFAEAFPDDVSEEEILRLYNERLETLIRRFPSQWVWFHKRWRSRPDGRVLSSRDYLASLGEGDLAITLPATQKSA